MLTLRGLTFDAAAPRIIVPLFARSLGALRPLAALKDKSVRFTQSVAKEHMVDQVLEMLR